MKKILKTTLVLTLAFLLLFSFAACSRKEEPKAPVSTEEASSAPIEKVGLWKDAIYTEDTSFGEGAKTVVVKVEADGQSVTFTLHTDKTDLADALLEHNLVSGDDSQFGLYIKRVNGILADYNVDQTYWGFFQNGETMMTGVDGTEIKGGECFELVRTK